MAGIRKTSAIGLVLAMTGLAMLAWWSMLAAERAAIRAAEDGARRAAVAAALAVRSEHAHGGDLAEIVALAEQAADLHLLVRTGSGRVVAGHADPAAQLVTAAVPGSNLSVAAEVDSSAGLGLGRYSHVITALAFLVMAGAVGMLGVVARDRRRTRAELERLGRRWDEVAAADDVTGLGNRTRLLEDAEALIARGSRYGNAFGLALFEVVGERSDAEIKAVAEVVAAQARGADLCYRVDERRFVTVLPEQDQAGAALAADRIRRVLEAEAQVPIRSGVAAFIPWLPCGADALLLRAELDLGASALLRSETINTVTPRP